MANADFFILGKVFKVCSIVLRLPSVSPFNPSNEQPPPFHFASACVYGYFPGLALDFSVTRQGQPSLYVVQIHAQLFTLLLTAAMVFAASMSLLIAAKIGMKNKNPDSGGTQMYQYKYI
ncbi:hypothetical protein ACO0LD_14270 [Undibacterium sp. Ji83W]|uniref:hypothetical protein n=1 Tax=Undibacterium sp. Ji83W TaxID=3413043 RepID=UPI003BEF86C6